MNARANKRRIMHRLYGRCLAWYPPDLGPLTEKDIEAIRKEAAKHLPRGKLLSHKQLFA